MCFSYFEGGSPSQEVHSGLGIFKMAANIKIKRIVKNSKMKRFQNNNNNKKWCKNNKFPNFV
jgi:hypothetical protein